MRRLTLDQAKRYALAAQGFSRPRPRGRIDVRHFRRVMGHLGLVQLDSVNVFARAHYMPFFSRLGPYDRDALDAWLWRSGENFEYWGHEASVMPVSLYPELRWRMTKRQAWRGVARMLERRPDFVEEVLEQVAERGPLSAGQLAEPGERRGGMWNWSEGKVALEALFVLGRVTTADRPNFTRLYDLTDRVIPRRYLEMPAVPRREAQSRLLLRAARALGAATADDLADYFRIRLPEARPLIEDLAKAGDLVEVEVEGWRRPAYLHPEATLPRRLGGTALLSPFDNLVFHRPRVERLWGFHYRIEIYVPAAERVHGYYVLPFLMNGELVGRVDLKTDRREALLRVKGAFAEAGADRVAVGRALRDELEAAAAWLGMGDVVVEDRGDLAPHL